MRPRLIAVAISVGLVMPIWGQARPDFNGKWKSASSATPAPVPEGVGLEFTVTQSTTHLMIAVAGISWAREFDLDGVGRDITMVLGEHVRATEWRMAKWDGTQLVLRNLSGRAEWTATWTLDAKGALLLESKSNFGPEPRQRKMSFLRVVQK